MAKTSKKKSGKEVEKPAKIVTPREQVPETDDEKPFDFGGLPDRDIKKNLGCGS